MRLDGVRDSPGRPDQREDVATMDARGGKDRHRRPGAHDLPQVDAAHRFVSRELSERAAVDLIVGDDDVERLGRDLEKLPVIDFEDAELLLLHAFDEHFPPPRDRQRVARLQDVDVIGLENPIGASDPLDEQTGVACQCFELAQAASDEWRSRLHGIRAVLDVPPCQGRRRRAPAHLLFVPPAFLLEVDAHDPRRELRQEPGGPDDANQIRDGKGDGDAVVIAIASASGRPSRAMASLAVPIVADSVSAPAMTPAAVPAS